MSRLRCAWARFRTCGQYVAIQNCHQIEVRRKRLGCRQTADARTDNDSVFTY